MTPMTRRLLVLYVAVVSGLAACGPPPLRVAQGSTRFVFGSAVYDVDRHELVFFGLIQRGTQPVNETWVWRAGTWTRLHPHHSPTPPRGGLLIGDPANHQVVLQGGSYTPPPPTAQPSGCGQVGSPCVGYALMPQTYHDTWLWNGSDWLEFRPGFSPEDVVPSVSVYAPVLHRPVVSFADHLRG